MPKLFLITLSPFNIRKFPNTDLIDHLLELLLLILLKSFVVLHRGHVKLMLGLRLGGLKRTGQDGNLCVL